MSTQETEAETRSCRNDVSSRLLRVGLDVGLQTKRAQKRIFFQPGFRQLGMWIRIGHNARTGERQQLVSGSLAEPQATAKGHGQFTVARDIEPTHGSGVPAPVGFMGSDLSSTFICPCKISSALPGLGR